MKIEYVIAKPRPSTANSITASLINLQRTAVDTKTVKDVDDFDFLNTKRYSADVLIGNWYEERFSDLVDNSAILPGLATNSTCLNDISEYTLNFKQPTVTERTHEFHEIRNQGYKNQLHDRSENWKVMDAPQFLQNMTTSYELLYRVWPQKFQELDCDPEALKYCPQMPDMLNSYGNTTNFGLRESKQLSKFMEGPSNITMYQEMFTPKRVLERQRRKFMFCQQRKDYRLKTYT